MDLKLSRLKNGLATLRTKLWFLPGIVAVSAFLLARALIELDHSVIEQQDAWFLFQGTPSAGRELVSTIASAMITFTGLVFSITVLVLQLGSGQFSPRVLRTFLSDRYTHIAMATFVGTFVFALGLLMSIRGASDEVSRFIPALSVFVAFVLVLVSTGVFIVYIHHIAHSIRAINVISRIGDELLAAIENMFPTVAEAPDKPPELARPLAPPGEVRSRKRGMLARVDSDGLFELAEKYDGLIELAPRIGEHVVSDAVVVRYWPADREELARAIKCLAFQRERSPEQDPMFGVRQLVDVAQRALSPGMNDPSTAVQVLDEIHEALRVLSRREFPNPLRANEDGTPRLILPRPEWAEFVNLALDEIREAARGSSQVHARLVALLDDCIAYAPPGRQAALRKQRILVGAMPDTPDHDVASTHGGRALGRGLREVSRGVR